jgi:hypothetical protein
MNGVAIPVLGQHHKGSFQPGGTRHVVDFGGTGLKMAGAPARPSLGQAGSDLLARARAAAVAYDRQLQQAASIANDTARGEILMWVGRADMPGSPAERYTAVLRDVAQAESGAAPYEGQIASDRVAQLEQAVTDLTSKVSSAIQAYGVLPASSEAGSRTEARDNTALCVAGGVALLALVVVPLLLD